MIINASKSAPNVRPRPYRPISIHQYLTLTELKDTAVQDGDKQLGRPTRTTYVGFIFKGLFLFLVTGAKMRLEHNAILDMFLMLIFMKIMKLNKDI